MTALRGGLWPAPVVMTEAMNGRGIPELAEAIARHQEYLQDGGLLAGRRRSRLKLELLAATEKSWRAAGERLAGSPFLDNLLDKITDGSLAPRRAAAELLQRLAGELHRDGPEGR